MSVKKEPSTSDNKLVSTNVVFPQKKAVTSATLRRQQQKQQQQQQQQQQNQQQQQPKENIFPAGRIETESRDVLDAYLHRHRYDAEQCSRLTQDLCSIVRSKVKQLLSERWKIVVQILMGEESGNCQNLRMASRCLWNNGNDEKCDSEVECRVAGVGSIGTAQDTFVSTVYRNKHIYAVCVVYAIYQT